MVYHLSAHQSLTPADPDVGPRLRRLGELGLGERPDPEFDDFARKLTEVLRAPYGMVNFIGEHRQFFAGLHVAPADPAPAALVQPGRVMERDHGYCPYVVARRKALALDDVSDYPRFAGNPIVDEIGIRSYLGAPLIDRTGTALGTVCVVDVEPRPWGRAGLETVKSLAAELIDKIHAREAGAR